MVSSEALFSLFPIPYSLFPIPYSLFPIPYFLFPRYSSAFTCVYPVPMSVFRACRGPLIIGAGGCHWNGIHLWFKKL